MASFPKARAGLLRHELEGETVVYDPTGDRVHLLDPTTSSVFGLLDGERSPAIIAKQLGHPADSELVTLALDGIARADLLDPSAGRVAPLAEVSRRDLVKRLGVAAAMVMLPAVISARPAEAAQSGGAPGPTCLNPGTSCGYSSLPCCNGACAPSDATSYDNPSIFICFGTPGI